MDVNIVDGNELDIEAYQQNGNMNIQKNEIYFRRMVKIQKLEKFQ